MHLTASSIMQTRKDVFRKTGLLFSDRHAYYCHDSDVWCVYMSWLALASKRVGGPTRHSTHPARKVRLLYDNYTRNFWPCHDSIIQRQYIILYTERGSNDVVQERTNSIIWLKESWESVFKNWISEPSFWMNENDCTDLSVCGCICGWMWMWEWVSEWTQACLPGMCLQLIHIYYSMHIDAGEKSLPCSLLLK